MHSCLLINACGVEPKKTKSLACLILPKFFKSQHSASEWKQLVNFYIPLFPHISPMFWGTPSVQGWPWIRWLLWLPSCGSLFRLSGRTWRRQHDGGHPWLWLYQAISSYIKLYLIHKWLIFPTAIHGWFSTAMFEYWRFFFPFLDGVSIHPKTWDSIGIEKRDE